MGTAAGPGPGASGMIAWAIAERPASLDPLYADSRSELLVTRQIHEPLVAELAGPFDSGRRVPGLALDVRPSDGARVWSVKLRRGVRFADGTPLTAQAVLRNAQRWQSSDVATQVLGEFLADAPRPDLVRFILGQPDSAFAERLADPRLGIVSPRVLDRFVLGEIPAAELSRSGTGAFELRERSRDSLLLARQTQWWGADRGLGPGVDQLEFSVIADPRERFDRLSGGSVQVAGELPPPLLRRVARDPLLTVLGSSGQDALGIERSVRGIPEGGPAPALNGAWRTGIDAG